MKEPKLKKDMLVKSAQKNKYEEQEPGSIDYSQFEANNWLERKTNKVLNLLKEKGGALWLSPSGNMIYRKHVDGEIYELSGVDKAKAALESFMKEDEILIFKGQRGIPADIRPVDLRNVEERFTPFVNAEFYNGDYGVCRTSFRPSPYLMLKDRKTKRTDIQDFDWIQLLIGNLVNGNDDYAQWMINWLAGFFQTLKRSGVSLVIKGVQGSGKGIFFKHIITPLFGEKYCVMVDQNRIESQFMPWVPGMLFYNLNEIAVDAKSRKNLRNFLKHLVTEESVFVELKHKDARDIDLFGHILITTNDHLPIEIEHSDRRFTVFQTGPSLADLNLKGEDMVAGIAKELEDFALFLRHYPVDWAQYGKCIDSPAKAAIVENTNSKLENFVNAILTRDVTYFEVLLESERVEDRHVYDDISDGFDRGFIAQPRLVAAYRIIFDKSGATAQSVGKQLRLINPEVFGADKLVKYGGGKVFHLPPLRGKK